jgi:hypothetical protein
MDFGDFRRAFSCDDGENIIHEDWWSCLINGRTLVNIGDLWWLSMVNIGD